MQLLGRLFARALAKTSCDRHRGDIGRHRFGSHRGLRGQPNVDVVVLHPHNRVSKCSAVR